MLRDSNESNDGNNGAEILFHESVFKPMYILGCWCTPDNDENPHISVSILLVSGPDENNEININVVTGVEYLEYSIKWSSIITNTDEKYRKSLSGNRDKKLLQSYHPIEAYFKQFILKLHDQEILFKERHTIYCLFELTPSLYNNLGH